METAFYDDGRSYVPSTNNKEEVRKRLTLDLNSPRVKKPRFDVLLSSPDLNMLKLPSPELEKMIMQQNGLLSATPTPGGFIYPTPTSAPMTTTAVSSSTTTSNNNGNNNNNAVRSVTREQEMYVRGFDDALAVLHQQAGVAQQQPSQIVPTGVQQQQQKQHHSLLETGSSISNNAQAAPFAARPPTSSSPYSMQVPVKEEPRCGTSLSSSPPMSPIDMEDQERIKLERKRQRNRIAASKCRRRKLERIARLEEKVKILKNDNSELAAVVVKLRQQVCGLKEQVMEHVNSGCPIMLTSTF